MKKGFTLIELLAVIVILAIIALIATPIILGIINDARKESNARSAELYLSGVELAIARKNLTEEFNPETCTITESVVTCDGKELSVEVDGKVPTSGTIVFKDNKVISGTVLTFDGFTATIEDGKVVVGNGDVTEPTIEPICTAVSSSQYGNVPANDSSGNRVFVPGDEYTCEVKEGTSYTFYVLSTKDNNINLIMDRNITTSAWVTKSDYIAAGGEIDGYTNDNYSWDDNGNLIIMFFDKGPITAVNALNAATASWDKVPNLNEEYNYHGIYSIKFTGKTRLPYDSEYDGLEDEWWNYPDWISTNLFDSLEGYWLTSIDIGFGSYVVVNEGSIYGENINNFNQNENWYDALEQPFGIRPVITLTKEYLK